MDPVEEINFREEIVRIVQSLLEIFHRLRERRGDGIFFLQWCPAFLHRDHRNRSIVRWLGNQIPRGVDSWSIYLSYKNLLESFFARRSLLREIGNRLPLQPCKRPYFYMLHKPSLEMQSTRLKEVGGPRFVHSTPCRNSISPGSIVWEGNNESCQENVFNQSSAVVTDDAVRKITALEDELSRLRAQIAGFVLKQEDPVLTCSGTTPGIVPPPPPPPPPPPLPAAMSSSNASQTPKRGVIKTASTKDGPVLDMSTILKDLNQVKLKAVERSPGGTPIRRAPRPTKGTDPASIIADALKNKFAKSRLAVASPDKENLECNSPSNSFSNTPSPQPYFRKPQERKTKPLGGVGANEELTSDMKFKAHAIPLRV